ncbi:MAG: DNA (cytosine-5-)-methyltransferase [Chloroflexi bacterium]|nr:DNA (cytosine-5-)-methyltransferase [Chloroflexota bacterium]
MIMFARDMSFSFIDLFAGIGGTRMAFEGVGGRCVFSSEWDAWACDTYEANFGERPSGDITEIDAFDIPQHDVLVGGFPCQPFSIAGVTKNNALGNEHGFRHATQGTLFFHIARILEASRPRAFLLENVKNLVSHDKGRTFETILRTLQDELSYSVKWTILDAQALLPQHRQRVYIVGFRDAVDFEFPELSGARATLSDVLEKRVASKYRLTEHLWNYLQGYAAKHRAKGNGFGYGLVTDRVNGVTRTLSARYYKDGSEILIPVGSGPPRRLTPRECARLQGFPDDFEIPVSDTQAYKQFGNSVAVPVVQTVARAIRDVLVKRRSPDAYVQGRMRTILINSNRNGRTNHGQKAKFPRKTAELVRTTQANLPLANSK